MCFVGKRDSKNLKKLVDATFQFHIVLYHCNQAVSDYSTIDLYAYSIF